MCKGIEESFYELDNFFKKLPADKKKLKGRDLKVSADGNDNDDKLHALASFRSSRDKFLSLYGGLVKFVDKKRSQVADESR